MIQTITAEELKKKIDTREDFRLIETLLPELYNQWHLPTAENIPADDMKAIAPGKLKKDEEIIVYCASFECQASTRAAKALLEMVIKMLLIMKAANQIGKARDIRLKNKPLI
jgi:rhodanese-related sulfurtransferase